MVFLIMKIVIIIPVYNEEKNLIESINSFINQRVIPDQLILVNDSSTDNSEKILKQYAEKHSWIKYFNNKSYELPEPGKKIIKAFNYGKKKININYDLIGKFDSDIILPRNYFQKIIKSFEKDINLGICSGILYIKKNNKWIYEDLHDKNHIRGALKLYSKKCFNYIGGLKETIGWDTLDELSAKYHRFNTHVDDRLIVKHLRPTAKRYQKSHTFIQGRLMYRLRYGLIISLAASLKLAWKNKNINIFLNCLLGFLKAYKSKDDFLVSKNEGIFIRNYRLKNIKKKLFK